MVTITFFYAPCLGYLNPPACLPHDDHENGKGQPRIGNERSAIILASNQILRHLSLPSSVRQLIPVQLSPVVQYVGISLAVELSTWILGLTESDLIWAHSEETMKEKGTQL